jgi:hypothetical protein
MSARPSRISMTSTAVRPPPCTGSTDLVADAEHDDQRDAPADQKGGGVHLRPCRRQEQDEYDDRCGGQARQEAEQQDRDHEAHWVPSVPRLIARLLPTGRRGETNGHNVTSSERERGCRHRSPAGRRSASRRWRVESNCRSLRSPKSQVRRTGPTHPTKGFRQIGGCPDPTLNVPKRHRDGVPPCTRSSLFTGHAS